MTIQANNDEEESIIRSSSIYVYTGSGSRSWFNKMNLQQAETIQTVVAMATGRKLSRKETSELLNKYHNNLLLPPGIMNWVNEIEISFNSAMNISSIIWKIDF